MNHKSGIVTRLYPECEDLPASSSVLTWRIVVRIIQNLSTSLNSLSLANNTGITLEVPILKEDFFIFNYISQDLCQCKDLRLVTLSLSGCSSVSPDGFLLFVSAQPDLVRLNIANSRKILSCLKGQTQDIFQALKSVRYLDISDNSIPHLRYLTSLDHLQNLCMNNIDSPSSEIYEALASGQIQSLKSRNLSLNNSKLLEILNER